MQSLSSPSQVSCDAGTSPWQVSPSAAHWVTPGAHTPGSPVSHGSPPPVQVSPLKK
nr:hypothetical protein [Sorangium cellulosum]